jgi:arsenate reductase
MAEGWARYLKGDIFTVYSAGIEKRGLDGRAVRVMAEAGIDISGQYSKHVDELTDVSFDYVITVCDHADKNCPFFPTEARIIHIGFEDPPRLALNAKTDEEALGHYRRIRDEIRKMVEPMPESLGPPLGRRTT